ncbi:thiamine phosphate synthase [Bacillus massiliigorillae]|uniref:thiamine phosphate synthase n=1 Tax=Bacillus massiliigorillae TaxID=1243664 RepID=UPI0003A1AFE3|nr:thiamine phosphate synthase [Bacillus massiliigorillae]
MKLIAVTDDIHSIQELATNILQIKNTVDFVHIREKSKTTTQLIELLNLLHEQGMSKEKIVMNDRLDVALLMDIPNVHLPSHGLPVKKVREMFPRLTIGQSVHTVKEAQQAEIDGADYVLYGHCYETNSKKNKAPNGIETISLIKSKLTIPIFAIGGITPERVNELQHLHSDGIAIMSGIFSATSPFASAEQYFRKCKENYIENKH